MCSFRFAKLITGSIPRVECFLVQEVYLILATLMEELPEEPVVLMALVGFGKSCYFVAKFIVGYLSYFRRK